MCRGAAAPAGARAAPHGAHQHGKKPRSPQTVRLTQGADGTSDAPSLSADGRWAAFTSSATDLGFEDINGTGSQVFVRDLRTGALRIVETPDPSSTTCRRRNSPGSTPSTPSARSWPARSASPSPGPVAAAVGFEVWLLVVASVISGVSLLALAARDVRNLRRAG